jgi:hypothetical protein
MRRFAAARSARFTPRRGMAAPGPLSDRYSGFGPHLAVQRDGDGPGNEGAASMIRNVVSEPGEPLDPRLREVMEPELGYDFSGVRIHTDTPAAQSADAIAANAYTAGDHIVFGAGRFNPSSTSGQRLLAHELAHVIQQADGPVAGSAIGDSVSVSNPDDPFERSAATFSEKAMLTPGAATPARALVASLPSRSYGQGPLAVQRADWGKIGGIAGIVGAGLALAGLVVAALAWLKPKNPNATAQGVTMQPNPFTFQATGTAASTPDQKKKYQAAAEGAPRVDKVLQLKTDNDNVTSFNLQRNTDGSNIIAASIVPGETKGYQGGYNSSIATVLFSPVQTNLPDASPSPAQPAAGTPATSDTASKESGASGGGAASSAAPAAQVAREVIHFSGTNAKSGDPTQTFGGELLVTGDGEATCTRCDVLNGIGYAEHSGPLGLVSYERAAPPSNNARELLGPQEEEKPGLHVPSLPDILPFNKPMAGGGT